MPEGQKIRHGSYIGSDKSSKKSLPVFCASERIAGSPEELGD